MNINITTPDVEGFEVDSGVQPRKPVTGEWYVEVGHSWAQEAHIDFESIHAIILRKKVPVYAVLDTESPIGGKYVEIKALEDAMKIMANMNMNPELDMFECNEYGALVGLLK